jgi:hypothetical protein
MGKNQDPGSGINIPDPQHCLPQFAHNGLSLYHAWLVCLALSLMFLAYSRGYKNRAIVKKLFGTLPIFYSGLECQLIVFIMFIGTRKGLNCLM